METLKLIITLALFLLICINCGGDNSVTESTKPKKSKIQIKDINAYPGNKRIKFSWELSIPSGKSADRIIISWSDNEDSLQVLVPTKSADINKDSVIVDSLSEGTYKFDFIAIGDGGTHSTQVLKKARVYGSTYQTSLKNRRIRNVFYDKDENIVTVYWKSPKNKELTTILEYEDSNGKPRNRCVPPSADSTVLSSYSLVDKHIKFTYQSMFLPEPAAIDTFISSVTNFDKKIYDFKHPGILVDKEDLKRIKTAVNQMDDNPAYKGYQKLMSSEYASLDYKPKAYADVALTASGGNPEEAHYRDDAHAAFGNALNWAITGDAKYKKKSIAILNLWANMLEEFHVTNRSDNHQITLETSWSVPIWVAAAEIIRYYQNNVAGWPSSDINNFKSFIKLQLSYVNGPIYSAPNWHGSRALARMSAGVFLNDHDLYQQGYNEAKDQIRAIGSSGKPSENARDGIHSQYNVIVTSQAAEIAYNQGNDALYMMKTSGKPVLLKQSEYYVKERMGDAPSGGIDYSSAGKKHAPPYEMVYARYMNKFGMSMPYTKQYIQKYNRPEGANESHFVGWGTLTHARK